MSLKRALETGGTECNAKRLRPNQNIHPVLSLAQRSQVFRCLLAQCSSDDPQSVDRLCRLHFVTACSIASAISRLQSHVCTSSCVIPRTDMDRVQGSLDTAHINPDKFTFDLEIGFTLLLPLFHWHAWTFRPLIFGRHLCIATTVSLSTNLLLIFHLLPIISVATSVSFVAALGLLLRFLTLLALMTKQLQLLRF